MLCALNQVWLGAGIAVQRNGKVLMTPYTGSFSECVLCSTQHWQLVHLFIYKYICLWSGACLVQKHVEWRTGSAVASTDAGYMAAAWANIAKLAAALMAMAVCTACLVVGWRAQRRPSHAPDPWKLPPPRVSRSGSDASSTGAQAAAPASSWAPEASL